MRKPKNKDERIWTFRELFPNGASEDKEKVIERLNDMGYFVAPASTKYHGNYEGGLFDHSYAVAKCLQDLTKRMELKWKSDNSPALVGLLHDLCKCDNYHPNGDGTYSYNTNLPLNGHGDKSVILAQIVLRDSLTIEEMFCIRWHMGAFDDKDNWSCYTNAIKLYPNVLWTHTADMMASHIEGV